MLPLYPDNRAFVRTPPIPYSTRARDAFCPAKRHLFRLVNPRRACAARVTVLGSVCVCVCVCVCVSALNLASRASFGPENHITHATGNENQKNRVDFSETAPLQRSPLPALHGYYVQSAILETAHAHYSVYCTWCTEAIVFPVWCYREGVQNCELYGYEYSVSTPFRQQRV